MSYDGSQAIVGRGTKVSIGPVSRSTAPAGLTGSTTTGSAAIAAVSSTAGIAIGMTVTGAGIPIGATVISKASGTFSISANATATASAVALTFGIGYTLIGECDDASPSGRTWDQEDVTNFQSAVDKEKKKTLRNPGKFSVKGNRVDSDAGQIALEVAFDDTASYLFKLEFPPSETETTGEIWTFSALVMSVDPPEVMPGKVIKFNADLEVTGPRTITPGA